MIRPLFEIYLPWPSNILSPNNRAHRFQKASQEKIARNTGYWLAKERGGFLPNERLQIHYIFHPPDRQKRDDDNFVSMMKSYRDGIFEALGQDDSLVKRSIADTEEPLKGGAVIMRIYLRSEVVPL